MDSSNNETTMSELVSEVKSTKGDEIPMRIVKAVAPGSTLAMITIINTSFRTGIFPNCFKIAKVLILNYIKTPIIKIPTCVPPIKL